MSYEVKRGTLHIVYLQPFVPLRSLKMLYKALIQPYFDYCSPLWDTCGKVHKDKLQVLQDRAARVRSKI